MKTLSLVLGLVFGGLVTCVDAGGGYEFRVNDVDGYVGETLTATVDLDINDDAIEGWQVAVCHDEELVELVSVTSGELSTSAFETITEESDHWVAVVLIDTDADETLAIGGEAYSAQYLLLDDEESELQLCDSGLDKYGVSVVVDSESVATLRDDASITSSSPFRFVLNGATASWDPDLELGSATVCFSIENDAETGANSFSMSMSHDPDYLEPTSGVALDPIEDLNDGDGPDFFSVNTEPLDASGLTIGCLFSFFNFSVTLDFADGDDLVELVYDVIAGPELGDDAIETSLTFEPIGEVKNAATFSLNSIAGVTTDGTFMIEAIESDGFRRGDCDGDGVVFAAIDAFYILDYGLLAGPAPDCLAAADCDGDGVVFPIIDAFFILNYGFLQGDSPPDPGPMDCGPDTEVPGLGCETPPDC